MHVRGVPDYGLVYGWSGAVHIVQGEFGIVPPLVQVRPQSLGSDTRYTQDISINAPERLAACSRQYRDLLSATCSKQYEQCRPAIT